MGSKGWCKVVNCKECGQEFLKTHKQPRQSYCSVKCKKQYNKRKYEKAKKINHFDVFNHDNFRCQYCGKTPADGVTLVVDHIYPIAKGGKSNRFNLTTACKECNTFKGVKLLSQNETIRRWDLNGKEFTYESAKEYWEYTQSLREGRKNE